MVGSGFIPKAIHAADDNRTPQIAQDLGEPRKLLALTKSFSIVKYAALFRWSEDTAER
jgi:hypothetical protein